MNIFKYFYKPQKEDVLTLNVIHPESSEEFTVESVDEYNEILNEPQQNELQEHQFVATHEPAPSFFDPPLQPQINQTQSSDNDTQIEESPEALIYAIIQEIYDNPERRNALASQISARLKKHLGITIAEPQLNIERSLVKFFQNIKQIINNIPEINND
jgi:hypothetical protein